jgi:PKD repeat protein
MHRLIPILLLLIACHGGQAQTLLFETFNTNFPAGWTIVNGGSNNVTWNRTNGGYNGQTLDGSEFMLVNSDAAGNVPAVWLHEELRTPAVNAAGLSPLMLEFDHYFRHLGQTDSGHVEVFDGATWHRIASFASVQGGFGNPAHAQYNITAYANANLQVRFIYDDNFLWAWYWAIDNVRIVAPPPIDAGISAFLSPNRNGRQLTSLALGATQAVSLQVKNYGTSPLSNVPLYFQVDGGAVIGPEMLAGPLTSSQTANFTFSATADLSALGTHTVQAWTGFVGDLNGSNDTADVHVRQLPNVQPSFPHCVNFESLPDTTFQSNVVGLTGLDELDFSTSVAGAGRLRTHAGTGFAHGGNRAVTFDRNPSGSPDAINFAVFTWNLSAFDANTDVFLLDLWLMDHGDEIQLRDSVWVRGCDACSWIRLQGWNQLTAGGNGIYFHSPSYNLSTALLSKGQNYSSSFQVRIGQEDNFAATSLAGSDGMTFDDVCLTRILAINAGVTALSSPLSNGQCGDSATYITLAVKNLGTNSLSNIPVGATVTGSGVGNFSAIIPGPVPSGGSANVTLGPFNSGAGGNFQIVGWTQMPGDSAAMDDSLFATVVLGPILLAPIASADTVCLGNTGWAYVVNPNAALHYDWYDSLVGGNLLARGDSLALGPQTVPRSFYVEPHSLAVGTLGAENNQIGAGIEFTSYGEGLLFDVWKDMVIDSVWVYPLDTGIVAVEIRNSAGLLVDSVAVIVNPAFANEPTQIPLGIALAPGSGYKIMANGSTVLGLYRNSMGAAYPYTLPGVASITGTLNNLPGYYYFFYHWKVSYDYCPGPRGIATSDTTSAQPQAAFVSTAQGLQLTFTNQSQHADQWHWDFGDGQLSNSPSPQHTYLTDGIYNVCLIAIGPCGIDTFCTPLVVECLPLVAGFIPTQAGLSLALMDTTAGATAWRWEFGDGAVAFGPNANHNYAVDGLYEVCLTTLNVCSDTAVYCDTLALCAPLDANIGFQQNGGAGFAFQFADLSNGTPQLWHWDFGDGATATTSSVTHTFSSPGSFIVTLVVQNLCGELDTATQNLTVVNAEIPSQISLKIYPNPASGSVHVSLPLGLHEACVLELEDLAGKCLRHWTLQSDAELSLAGIAKGCYLLRCHFSGGMQTLRLMIERI